MREPATPVPDDKDWTWVLTERCPDCGFDPAAVGPADIARYVDATTTAFSVALAGESAAERPSPAVWSALEYAAHVRDVDRMTAMRVRLMLGEDDPEFANWDQDATALEARYWDQPPVLVANELRAAADDVTAAFADVTAEQWQRPGRRSNGARFTIESLGVYFVHDLVHHVHDIGAG